MSIRRQSAPIHSKIQSSSVKPGGPRARREKEPSETRGGEGGQSSEVVAMTSSAVSPLSGTLSALGAEVRAERISLLSKLITKLTGFGPGDENFDIALDFALYNVSHHSFLDVDPSSVEELFDTLEKRLELNACLVKQKRLVESKKKVLAYRRERDGVGGRGGDEILMRDANHRILSLLYWLTGNPINSTLETELEVHPDSREASAETTVEVGDHEVVEAESRASVQEEIDLCDSSSSLSDWDSETCSSGGEEEDGGRALSNELAVSEGLGAGESENGAPPSDPGPRDVDAGCDPARRRRRDLLGLARVNQTALSSESRLVRQHLLTLRGQVPEAGERGAQGASPSLFERTVERTVEDLARKVRSLQATISSHLGDQDPPTLLAFVASLQSEVDTYHVWLVDTERSMVSSDTSITLLSFKHDLDIQVHRVNHLEQVTNEVVSSFDGSDASCVTATRILSTLQSLWFQSDLDVEFESFNPTQVLYRLFRSTLQPYLQCLHMYLTEGRCVDPRGEFFVEIHEDVSASCTNFWSEGHTLRMDEEGTRVAAPSFLLGDAETILLAGRSLKVLHGNGKRARPNLGLDSVQDLEIPLLEVAHLSSRGSEPKPKTAAVIAGKENLGGSALGASSRQFIEDFREAYRDGDPMATSSPTSILAPLVSNQGGSSLDAGATNTNLRGLLFGEKVSRAYDVLGATGGGERLESSDGHENGKEEGEGRSPLCPPQEVLLLSAIRPIQRYCQGVERALLDTLREDYSVLDEMSLVKDVFLHCSANILGGFARSVFDRMETDKFWRQSESDLAHLFGEECAAAAAGAGRGGPRALERMEVSVKREGGEEAKTGSLAIAFDPSWPLNLVVDAETISQYNEVFGFLVQILRAKHALHKLFSAKWSQNAPPRVQNFWNDKGIDFVRQEFSHFVQVMQQYVADQVLGTDWEGTRAVMEGAPSLGDLVRAHKNFVSSAASKCLIGSERSAVVRCLNLVLLFCATCRDLIRMSASSDSLEEALVAAETALEGLREEYGERRTFILTVLGSKVRLGYGVSHLGTLVKMLEGTNQFYA